MQENLATLFEVVADVAGDRPAAIQGTIRRGWRELDERAARLARYLSDAGVEPGDRVAIALYTGLEYVETVLAVMKLRCSQVNVNYRYRERELRDLLDDAGASALVMDGALTPVAAAALARLPGVHTVLRLGKPPVPPDPLAGRADDYEHVLSEAQPLPPARRSGEDEWLMFTGGTTGRPKGVAWRHADLVAHVLNSGYGRVGAAVPTDLAELRTSTRRLLEEADLPVNLVVPPLMHGTGIYSTFGTLIIGGTVVFRAARSHDPDEVATLIEQLPVTDLCIVGDAFARPLADALDRAAAAGRPYDLSSLRRVLSVGVTWTAEVKERLLRHCDARLDDVIAASEGGPFARSVTYRGERSITSRFELMPSARVIDENGADITPGSGQVGLLAAPAPTGTHYLGDPERSAATFRDIDGRRYVVPGDLATIEADGTLVLLGRDGRVINTGGEKVFAEEVEQVIAGHPDVEDVCVVGIPDERFGHRVAAVIAVPDGKRLTPDDIRARVTAELADYKQPREIVFVDELPRSPAGKLDLKWARSVFEH
ncbi:MAG TPA: AMP-binding protein [Streptosporangiaceae bacterium]|jgi:fatty-acyl-CoA synthase|nr:AMP-binding protein [Streptosporangiaceae bacterium]